MKTYRRDYNIMFKKSVLMFMIAITLSVVSLFSFASFAADIEAEPTLTIHSNNLSYADSIYLAYAVCAENLDLNQHTVKMLFWNSPEKEYIFGTQDYISSPAEVTTVKGKLSAVIYSKGIAAKNLPDTIYARAYVEANGKIIYSDVFKYSPLQYLYERKNNPESSADQIAVYDALIAYGASAQTLFSHDLERLASKSFYNIAVSEGTLSDGFDHGLYVEGENVTLSCSVPDGMLFSHWEDSAGNKVGETQTLEIQVPAKAETYSPVFGVAATFTVTFTDGEGNIIDTQTVKSGEAAHAPEAPAKTCKEFSAWDKSFENITEDIVVNAIYTENHIYENSRCVGCGKYKESNMGYFTPEKVGDTYHIKLKATNCPAIVVIPEAYEGIPITGISADGFNGNTSIQKLVLSKNLETIGYQAFTGCTSLTEIIIPEGSSLKSIGTTAFAKTALTEITLPEGLISIGTSAFYNCTALKTVNLPASLTNIQKSAFKKCSSLEAVNFASPDNWYIESTDTKLDFSNAENAAAQLIGSLKDYILEKRS